MKKIVLLIVSVLMVFGANAQGTWKAPAAGELNVTTNNPIATGIANLTVTHNFAQPVTSKSDADAPAVTFNDVTYNNKTIAQADGDNGQYIIFSPEKDGTLDVCGKMGGGKKNIVLETSKTPAELSGFLVKSIVAGIDDETFPTVTATGKNADGSDLTIASQTWDGTAAINPTGANQWIVMSFPVKAGKNYVVGVDGSKMMLVGINYKTKGASIPALNTTKEVKSVEYYDLTGKKLNNKSVAKGSVLIEKTTYIDGTFSNSKTVKK